MQLSERKKQILKSVIDSYIASGEPVGSKSLTGSKQLSVSSATIRNEMSELEEMGFLHQLHTSSGRVPTALGYRTYVDSLMEKYLLSIEEINILNELMTYKMDELDSIMEKASHIISELTNYTSFAYVKETEIKPKRFEVVYIDEHSLMLVMICENGSVKNVQVHIKASVPLDSLSVIQNALNQCFCGISMDKISMPLVFKFEELLQSFSDFASSIVRAIYEMLSESEKEKVHVEGVTKLLSYPEYSSAEKVKNVLGLFEGRDAIADMIERSKQDDLNVVIGDEDSLLNDTDSSFVVHPITIDGKNIGAIGVIGPKRMDYKKVIAGLNYIVSGLTGELNEKEKNESENQ